MFNMFAPFSMPEAPPGPPASLGHPLYARLDDYWEKKVFRCQECRYTTDRKNNLKRHIATMHQECDQVLECCDIKFACKASLRNHAAIFHRNGYRCRLCNRNFCRKALLKRHLSVHSGQKDFVCELCDYATSHKSNLERHKKVHRKFASAGDAEGGDGSPGSSRDSADVDVNVEDVDDEDDDDDDDDDDSEGNASSERGVSESSGTPGDASASRHSPDARRSFHSPGAARLSPEMRARMEASPLAGHRGWPELGEMGRDENGALYALAARHRLFDLHRPYFVPSSLLPPPYVGDLLRPAGGAGGPTDLLKPLFRSDLMMASPYCSPPSPDADALMAGADSVNDLPLKKRFRRKFGILRERPSAPSEPTDSVGTPSTAELSHSSPGSGQSVRSCGSPVVMDMEPPGKMSSPTRIFSRPYKCSRCGTALSSQGELTRHVDLWHAPTVWPLQPIVTIIAKRKKLGLSTDLRPSLLCQDDIVDSADVIRLRAEGADRNALVR